MILAQKYKIKSVVSFTENLELLRPYTIAYETFDSVENIFVKLELGDGTVGFGAGSPSDFVTGETLESAQTALAHVEGFLLGKDIRKIAGLIREMEIIFPNNPSVRAAVDIALHDAFAKRLGLPLIDIWGRAHQQLPTSITIGIKSLEDSILEAKEYKERGFKAIKLKTGKSVEEDIEIFSKIRETVGVDITIRVDANQGYSVRDTLQFYEATKVLDLELIEQPLDKANVALMQELPTEIRQKCMADENLLSPKQALLLTNLPLPFGLFNIKLMKCGGLQAGKQIADIAHLADIKLMWGCMDESIISITAALHVALASPATRYLDLDGSLDLAKDMVAGGFILENGYMRTNEAAGLGVQALF